MVQILAFTDIHGAFDVVEQILQTEARPEMVLLGGDLTTFGSERDVEAGIGIVRQYCDSILAVGGNMDPRPLEETYIRLGVSLNGRGVMIGEVGFFGVSGAPISPLKSPHEISEEEILQTAEAGWEKVAHARWKVFVPHVPPYNTTLDRIRSGRHVGSTAVDQFIRKHQPDVVVCGHIHESRGMERLGNSRAVNCGPAERGSYASIRIAGGVSVELRQLPRQAAS